MFIVLYLIAAFAVALAIAVWGIMTSLSAWSIAGLIAGMIVLAQILIVLYVALQAHLLSRQRRDPFGKNRKISRSSARGSSHWGSAGHTGGRSVPRDRHP